jgi:hypothetical protein
MCIIIFERITQKKELGMHCKERIGCDVKQSKPWLILCFWITDEQVMEWLYVNNLEAKKFRNDG